MNPNPPPPTPNPTPKADSGAGAVKTYRCDCGWIGLKSSLKERPHPKFGDGCTILVCPQCGADGFYISDGPPPAATPQDRVMGIEDAELVEALGGPISAATPPQSDPALAAAETIVYHNPDNLPSPGEPPWRFLVKGEEAQNGDEAWEGSDWFTVRGKLQIETEASWTYRTMRPLPLAPAPAPLNKHDCFGGESALMKVQDVGWTAPAPAPEGRGETAETPETNEAWIAAKEKYLATYSPASKASHWFKVAEETREHAKRLERERNHLRKKVAQYRADFENANYRNEEMRRERDAAVAQAQALREAVDAGISAFEDKERGIAQAHIAAQLVQELTAALAASEAGK